MLGISASQSLTYGILNELGPCLAVVLGMGHEDATRIFAEARFDLSFVDLAGVPRQQQPDDARVLIHNRAWIAARVRPIVPHNLRGRPRPATVTGTSQQQVNLASVGAAVLTAL